MSVGFRSRLPSVHKVEDRDHSLAFRSMDHLHQSSNKEYVLSDYEAPISAMSLGFNQCNVDSSMNLDHTLTCEQGGMPSLTLAKAMRADAESQIQMINLLANRLDLIVQINDQRKVNNQSIGSLKL